MNKIEKYLSFILGFLGVVIILDLSIRLYQGFDFRDLEFQEKLFSPTSIYLILYVLINYRYKNISSYNYVITPFIIVGLLVMLSILLRHI